MQMLFQWDMSHQEPTKLEDKFWRAAKATDSTREFANRLFEGTASDVVALDQLIVKHAENWRLERLAIIDRAMAVMRPGAEVVNVDLEPVGFRGFGDHAVLKGALEEVGEDGEDAKNHVSHG